VSNIKEKIAEEILRYAQNDKIDSRLRGNDTKKRIKDGMSEEGKLEELRVHIRRL
jgi:hypothetical protein